MRHGAPLLLLLVGGPLAGLGVGPTGPGTLEAQAGRHVQDSAAVERDARDPGGGTAAEADAWSRAAALPTPVLLVPGWGDEADHLATLRRRLVEAGWPARRVVALEFEDPVGSNRTHALEIAAASQAILESTGAADLDIVAHSMGGLATRRYLLSLSGDPPVRKVVFLATPHRGTVAAFVAWGEGGDEMQPGSPFLDSLNAGPFVPESVEALAVRTPVDLRVVPGESAILPEDGNARNVEVCCPTHSGLLDDEEAFRRIVEFLREGGPDGG